MSGQRIDWTTATQAVTEVSTVVPVINKLFALTDQHTSKLMEALEIDPTDTAKLAIVKEHVSSIAIGAVEEIIHNPLWLLKAAEQVNQGYIPLTLVTRYWTMFNEHR